MGIELKKEAIGKRNQIEARQNDPAPCVSLPCCVPLRPLQYRTITSHLQSLFGLPGSSEAAQLCSDHDSWHDLIEPLLWAAERLDEEQHPL